MKPRQNLHPADIPIGRVFYCENSDGWRKLRALKKTSRMIKNQASASMAALGFSPDPSHSRWFTLTCLDLDTRKKYRISWPDGPGIPLTKIHFA